MGETIRLKCNDCNKAYDLNIGQGIKDNSLDRILGYFDGVTSDMISRKLSVLGTKKSWSFRRMIGYCSSCRSFREIPTFHIFEDQKEYVTATKCQCGSTCEIIDDNDTDAMGSLICPECGGKISSSITAMWD